MEMPDVNELCDYWADNPPPHLCLRSILGLKTRKRRGIQAAELNDLEKHVASMPAARMTDLPVDMQNFLMNPPKKGAARG